MSLFGSLMGDFDEDPMMGYMMNSSRQINNIMNSLLGDPFSMMSPFDGGLARHSALTGARNNALMPFGFPAMPNMNRLLSGDFGNGASTSYCSSSFVSMSQGPDGRPQVYQATSSSKSGPGGVRETHKTIQDSRTGLKKMAIGHHIGERAHIIEREQNVRTGEQEERQDYINLDEEEADDFNKEFTTKARTVSGGGSTSAITYNRQTDLPALPAPPSPANTTPRRAQRNIAKVSPRRPIRTHISSPLALPSSSQSSTSSITSVHPHPYNTAAARRNHRHKKHHNNKQNSTSEQ